MTKAKRELVLSQVTADPLTPKKVDEASGTEAKVSQFQLTTMLRRTSCARPMKRRLYVLKVFVSGFGFSTDDGRLPVEDSTSSMFKVLEDLDGCVRVWFRRVGRWKRGCVR